MSVLPFPDIEEQFGRDVSLRREDVASLDEWQRQQPHLPAPLHPLEPALFLHRCKNSKERAKQRIEAFYTIRTHCPELFAKCDPRGPELQQALDVCLFTTLPQLTQEGYLVFYHRLLIRNVTLFDFKAALKLSCMMAYLSIAQRGCLLGHIGVIDLEGVTLAHIAKCNILSMQKFLIFVQNALPAHIKGIHFINGASVLEKLMAIARPFIRQKFIKRIHFHSGDNSTILEFLPEDLLPIECGGSKFNATEYYKNVTRQMIESHSEYFLLQERQVADESKRIGKPVNVGDLFGVEGTFRKFELD